MATRFKGPVQYRENNNPWFKNLSIGENPDYSVYFNDFLVEQDYAAADWVITTTEAGAGSASEALATDERYGALVITNDDADNDSDSLQSTQEFAALSSGKRTWFETRIKLNDADQVDVFIGLCITDTTPLVATDRVGFQIDDEDASILCKSEKNSTETSTDSGEDAADDTYVKLGFYWDGASAVEFYVDRELVATHTTNIPDDENLAITMHLVNGEAAAQSMTVDYLYVAQER